MDAKRGSERCWSGYRRRRIGNQSFDADLGGKVYKKRIALPSRGKRGSVRALIAYQDGDRAFFMYGFAKNVRENIDADELAALKLMAKTLLEKSGVKLKKDLEAKILIEICNDG